MFRQAPQVPIFVPPFRGGLRDDKADVRTLHQCIAKVPKVITLPVSYLCGAPSSPLKTLAFSARSGMSPVANGSNRLQTPVFLNTWLRNWHRRSFRSAQRYRSFSAASQVPFFGCMSDAPVRNCGRYPTSCRHGTKSAPLPSG